MKESVHLNVDHTDGAIELTQVGLIDRIVFAMGLTDATEVKTPVEYGALQKDEDGENCDTSFNYPSIVGMLLYLQNNTRPDITFAVSQCARYTFCPKFSHEKALKRMGRDLKGSNTKGIIMKPYTDLNIDCYVDSDFAGLWEYEYSQDPTCVRSRTGYTIMISGCLVLLSGKLQTEIELSTMEAEYIALSTSLKQLIPFKRLVDSVWQAVGLTKEKNITLNTTVWEDNQGCLILANLEPPRMTPRSKHYAIKYHSFRTQLKPNGIVLKEIASSSQLADMFTKGFRRILFEANRSKSMGW